MLEYLGPLLLLCTVKCRIKLLIHLQALTAAPLSLGINKKLHPSRYDEYDYLFMMGLKLNHFCETRPR